MSEDFFDKQDRIFDLTEKVLRLCGEAAYKSLPAMSLAETDEALERIEAKANNLLRLRRNAMARSRYRKDRPTRRGRWSHRQVFTMFLREYGPDAKHDDSWRHFKQDNEIVQCDHCGGYSELHNGDVDLMRYKDDILHFCDGVCRDGFLKWMTEAELPFVDDEDREIWHELQEGEK